MEQTVARSVALIFIAMLLFVPQGATALPAENGAIATTQSDDGSASVTVTRGGDPVPNASVTISPTGTETYQGAGRYWTDRSGTVELPAPRETLTVSVRATADSWNTTTEVTLVSSSEQLTQSFGALVAGFVQALQNETDSRLGPFDPAFTAPPRSQSTPAGPPPHAGGPDESRARNGTTGNAPPIPPGQTADSTPHAPTAEPGPPARASGTDRPGVRNNTTGSAPAVPPGRANESSGSGDRRGATPPARAGPPAQANASVHPSGPRLREQTAVPSGLSS